MSQWHISWVEQLDVYYNSDTHIRQHIYHVHFYDYYKKIMSTKTLTNNPIL